jgi:hypothetical protein
MLISMDHWWLIEGIDHDWERFSKTLTPEIRHKQMDDVHQQYIYDMD